MSTPNGTNNPLELWSWDRWLGNDTNAGLLPVGGKLLGSIMEGWGGIQQMNLAKRQQAFNENMARTNLANQANLTNERLLTRQQNRYRTDPTNAMNPDEFMKKWAVKGTLG